MRELDENIGKIYVKDDFYYLEKVYSCLATMIEEEPEVKRRALRHNFHIVNVDWSMEKNPYFHIEQILNEEDKEVDKNRYRLKFKLEYKK